MEGGYYLVDEVAKSESSLGMDQRRWRRIEVGIGWCP